MTPAARLETLIRDTATPLLPERLRKLQSVPAGAVDFGGLRKVAALDADPEVGMQPLRRFKATPGDANLLILGHN